MAHSRAAPRGELSSGEIAESFALRWPTVSRHLAVLEEAGLVRKGIRGRRRVYAADADGLAGALDALRQIRPIGAPAPAEIDGDAPASNAPTPRMPVDVFVGRERELVELTALLAETRTLTIAGAPGVGKTRLAREVAARVAGTFEDGVRWVKLARVSDPADVAQAIANVLEIKERGGQSPSLALVTHLRSKHLLLVLDNSEHVRGACAEVVQGIAEACSSVNVLATSQAELEAPAETVWRLSPLSLAGGDGDATDSEAVQLFKARARAIRPDFALDAAGERAVDELCRRLDGIPLAIELAAARVGVLTPYEITERLSDRFALLAAPRATDLERHQTLRGALAWSHALLSRSQQQLLSRMSVFVGSAELQAIESVCGTDSDSVLTDLTHLVAGSLVIGDTSGSRARYRLLECIRAYGAEQAAAAGETEALRTRHLHWFLDLAERAEPELGGGAEQPWMAQLEADVDNLRTALSWATESGDSGSALRLSSALVLYWRVRNRFREGRRWLDAAMALSDGNPAPLLTRAQWGAGFMALMLNDLSAAVDHLDASLALAHQTDDTRGRARALLLLGNAWMLRPPSPTPMPAPGVAGMLTESAALARRVGDAWCRAHALSLLGWAHMRSGDTAAARKPLEEALAVARDAGDRQGLRLSLTMLGRLAHSDGDTAAAEAFLFEAVDISDELGDGFGVGAALATLSEMAMRRGDYDGAATLLERAAVLLTEAEPSAFRHLRTRRGGAGPGRHRQRSPLVHRGSGSSGRDQREAGARRAWADGPHRRRRACCAGALRAGSVGRGQPDGRGGAVRARGGRAGWGRPAARLVAEHSALDMRGRLRDTPGVLESLESLACIASEGGRHDHAARLFGAVSALSSAARLARPHHREHRTAIALAATRRELGRSAFRAAFAAGEALSMRHAISYATRGRGARRRPRTGWGSLTQMERAVVAQAIQGLSNAEIAKQLFISPHTAAWHLSQVYAKLGISSRTQLAYHVALRSDAGRNNP